jgi:hypothetical protein
MGSDPFDAAAVRRLEVTISRRDGELWVAMGLRGEDGALVWEESAIHTRGECGALVSALGLSIAIRLEPEPEPAQPCPVCPPPPPPPPAPKPPPEPPPRVPALMLGGGPRLAIETQSPSTGGAVGAPIAVAPGVALFAGVRWPVFSLAVETRLVLPGTRDDQLARIRPVSLAALVVPCTHYRWLFGCGLFAAGIAAPAGPDAPPRVRLFGQLGAGLRAGAEKRMGRLLIRGHADFIGTFVQEYMRLAFPGEWNVPEVVGTLGVDVAVLFPASSGRSDRLVSTSSTPRKD